MYQAGRVYLLGNGMNAHCWYVIALLVIGLMHLTIFLGEYPFTVPSLVLETKFKSGNSPIENQCFSTLQRGANGISNVEKYWFSRGEISTFKNENEAWSVMGHSPRKLAKCIIIKAYWAMSVLVLAPKGTLYYLLCVRRRTWSWFLLNLN